MSGVQAEAQEAGCRISRGQVGDEFITLSNQKRFPIPLFSGTPRVYRQGEKRFPTLLVFTIC